LGYINAFLINTKIDSRNESSRELRARKVYTFEGKANKSKLLLFVAILVSQISKIIANNPREKLSSLR